MRDLIEHADELAAMPEARALFEAADCGWVGFTSRPDQVERKDQQTAFIDSRDTGVSWHIGGTGAGTSVAGMVKASEFVLSVQAPPRFDTPFWIIGEGYEQVIENCWKEKLCGMGLLPDCEIQWDRITWKSEKAQQPFTVPLRPWPTEKGGHPRKNWVIEFRSYDQGWQKMQARSIGGFCFSEQFPYVMLTEVLARCREYNYPGSKMCEFTPLDPAKSIEIETMIEEDDLPPGWAVYRANTMCAKEAGHVSEEWFNEFYGAISDEMHETRMTGEFPKYEGGIYQSFNPTIHATKRGERLIVPLNCQHRKGLDWGAGPENAFACVWGARDAKGKWYIYDEYWSTDPSRRYPEHRNAILDKKEWPPEDQRYGVCWADPSEKSWINVFSLKMAIQGARTGPGSVQGGIEAVRQALKISADGDPMLMIDRDACPNLMREMRTYRWKKSTGKGANPADAKPEPLKKDDHMVDALRYMIFSEQQISTGGPARRWVERPVPKHLQYQRKGRG